MYTTLCDTCTQGIVDVFLSRLTADNWTSLLSVAGLPCGTVFTLRGKKGGGGEREEGCALCVCYRFV